MLLCESSHDPVFPLYPVSYTHLDVYKRQYENNGGYNPIDIYFNDWDIKRVVDQLVDGTYGNGDRELYRDLYNSLLNTNSSDRADTYFILKDFRSYAEAQKRVRCV